MEKKKTTGRKNLLQRVLVITVFALIVLIGVNILFYPQLSNYINTKNGSRVIADYDEAVADLSKTDYSACLKAAREYNAKLASGGSSLHDAFAEGQSDVKRTGDYWKLLNVDGDGVMGYIEIQKIDVKLPIYHGTDEAALASGAGHLQGSSLPVGGASTHAVISAHTGLPSAELFTDLDQLEEGDTFALHVLGDTYTYQIDQILTVLPDEVDALKIASGEDYVTLVTCTPYGINSHRLLVRGKRIANPKETDSTQTQKTQKEQNWFQKLIHKVFVAFANAFEAVITVFVRLSEKIMGLFHISY